jgi:excinuclease ABC subunit B
MQYERTQYDLYRGAFRLRGDTLEVFPAHEDFAYRVEFFGDRVERIHCTDPVRGKKLDEVGKFTLFPATHFAAPQERLRAAMKTIREELRERVEFFRKTEKPLEAERIEQRTNYDLEMMEQAGFCSGIENYSRHISGRRPGEPPATLIDYFPKDYLLIVDESHQTLPQVQGMQHGDRSRKQTLVDFGFRLPSAIDNRPLSFDEFLGKVNQVVCVSATPGPYEMDRVKGTVAEQIIRPTGLLDPEVEIRPTKGQVQDLEKTVREVVAHGERVLVTTLTKRMAEDLTQHYTEQGIRCRYLHSDIDTLERIAILTAFRRGEFDCLIGINLLREGLDLPEVSLVAILDADQEGFLRSATSLIQTAGRAARNLQGRVILYADTVTNSMKAMMDETTRRRKVQTAYNKKHGIVPETIVKDISSELVQMGNLDYFEYKPMDRTHITDELTLVQAIKRLELEMKQAAKAWDFEKAAKLRDELVELKKTQIFA